MKLIALFFSLFSSLINYNEVKEYNAFCESIGVEKNFRVDDYPEYSVCGAFIYPEELLVE